MFTHPHTYIHVSAVVDIIRSVQCADPALGACLLALSEGLLDVNRATSAMPGFFLGSASEGADLWMAGWSWKPFEGATGQSTDAVLCGSEGQIDPWSFEGSEKGKQVHRMLRADLYRSLTSLSGTKCKRFLVAPKKGASTWSIWHQATSPSLEAESKTWAPSCNSAEGPPHQPSRGGALNSAPTSQNAQGMLNDSKSQDMCNYHYKSSRSLSKLQRQHPQPRPQQATANCQSTVASNHNSNNTDDNSKNHDDEDDDDHKDHDGGSCNTAPTTQKQQQE